MDGPVVITVDARKPDPAALAPAAALLRAGGLVAFPTETVYGLGAHALDAAAVRRIFEAKGRPAEDPLIVHVLGLEDVPALAPDFPPLARRLAEAFWPGPLTLVVPRGPAVPDEVTAGLDSVALRAPAHPVARALLRAAGLPVAAPSANPFGRTSPTRAGHVLADLGARIDMLIDGGPSQVGVESSVVDCRGPIPILLRPGGISAESLRAVVGELESAMPPAPAAAAPSASLGPQRSPGTQLRHYAPRARLLLIEAESALLRAALDHALSTLGPRGLRVGLLLAAEDLPAASPEDALQVSDRRSPVIRCPGPLASPEEVARELFACLRELDAAGVDIILARDFGRDGLALAIHDRLRRAAEGRVLSLTRARTPASAAAQILSALDIELDRSPPPPP